MTLTAAQIKTQLDAITFTNIDIKRINAYVEKNESHRKYPSIDIQNITGQEEIEGLPTKTTKQVFLVHLYVRTRATGADQEPDIKETENQIFDSLDSLQTMDEFVQVIQGWDRKSETFPLSRVVSTIRVTSEAISSTDGEGIVGDKVSITLPIVGTIDVINVITDEAGIIKDLDLGTASEEVFTKIRNDGILSVEVAVSVSDENNIKTQIFAAKDITITFTKGGVPDQRTVNLSTLTASGPRSEVQTQILAMDVLN